MNDSQKLVEHTLSSQEVFNGRLLHVFFDKVRLPDQSNSTREWIDHPGASAIIPIFRNGDVMMVRQFRYPIKNIFYEVPAGKLDPGDTAGEAAKREVNEEAGLICNSYAYIGHFYPVIGYSNEIIHLYVAWDIEIAKQQVDDDEFLIKERMPFQEALQMVHNGEITDGKTIIALLRTWHWWQEEGPFDI